jgi:hypothetical protein
LAAASTLAVHPCRPLPDPQRNSASSGTDGPVTLTRVSEMLPATDMPNE